MPVGKKKSIKAEKKSFSVIDDDRFTGPFSAEAREALTSLLSPGEKLIMATGSDLTSDGSFGDSCFAVTRQRVFSFTVENAVPVRLVEVAVNDIVSFNRRDFHGFCRLEIITSDRAVIVAHFARNYIEHFVRVIDAINPFLTDGVTREEKQKHKGGDRKAKLCPTCQKPIPRWLGVCPDCINRQRIIARLLERARPYLFPMVAGFGFMLFITIIDMAQPVLTKIMLDTVIPNRDFNLFAWIVLAIVGIHLGTAAFSGVRSYLMAWLGEKITHDLRSDMYRHLQRLSIDFYDQHETGWIMDRVSADTSNLQDFLAEGFQDMIRDVMSIVIIVTIMLTMNWQLSLITLIPAPFVFILTMRFMKRIRRQFHRVWRKRSRMTALLSDVIPGTRVVKAFAQEHREIDRFVGRSQDYMKSSVENARNFATFHPVIDFITSIGFIMVWGVGGYLVISDKGVTVGTLIAFISYLWRFYGPLNNLSRFSRRVERAFTSAQRVFDVLDTPSRVEEQSSPVPLKPGGGSITFNNVTFGYEPAQPVLEDVSFHVEAGEMIGLVGPSGAGKSTTINLLCRFYDVEKGSIEIDGTDIRSVSLSDLHQAIGVVLQEPFLFHGTIAQNIAYGKPDATLPEIIRAAKAANAHDFIMKLPEGYDAMAGERGQHLSGGERQRISIARAILKDPKILVLDEATSSVDTETESAIQKAVERLVQGRTTFAIAHRFSTLRNADRLVVLEHGRIAEIGTHAELLAKENGVFRRLCNIQTQNNQIIAVGG